MPLAQYLNGRSYQPEMLTCMGQAFDAACARLGIADKDDPFTQMVAGWVIALVQRGESDPVKLCERGCVRSLS